MVLKLDVFGVALSFGASLVELRILFSRLCPWSAGLLQIDTSSSCHPLILPSYFPNLPTPQDASEAKYAEDGRPDRTLIKSVTK